MKDFASSIVASFLLLLLLTLFQGVSGLQKTLGDYGLCPLAKHLLIVDRLTSENQNHPSRGLVGNQKLEVMEQISSEYHDEVYD